MPQQKVGESPFYTLEAFFHKNPKNEDEYTVLEVLKPKQQGRYFKLMISIAKGKKGGERQTIMISLDPQEALLLAKILEVEVHKELMTR